MDTDKDENHPDGGCASTDEYVTAVAIGAREASNSTIYLAPYDLGWVSGFLLLADWT